MLPLSHNIALPPSQLWLPPSQLWSAAAETDCIECPIDLCELAKCVDYPKATCVTDDCSCTSWFIDANAERVECWGSEFARDCSRTLCYVVPEAAAFGRDRGHCAVRKRREAQLGLGNATRRELYSERWQSTRNLLWIQEYSRIAAIFAIPVVSRKSNSFAIRIFFRWDIPVISPITVLKLAMIVFTSLYFRTSWPNWFKFFSVSSKQFGLRPKTTKAAIRILTLPLLKTAAAEPLQSNATFDRDRRLYHDRARIDIALKRQKKKHSTAQIRITAHFSQAR